MSMYLIRDICTEKPSRAVHTATPSTSGAMGQGDDPSAADVPNSAEDEGPRVDPAEPFRWALGVIAALLTLVERRFVDDFLANVLPLAFELSGRYEGATEVRAMLNKGHPQRAYLVGATGAVAAAVLAVTGVIFWALLIRTLALARVAAANLLRTVASFVVAVLWHPRWWGTFPFVIGIASQRHSPSLRALWPQPIFVWAVGGGWWGAIGVVLVSGITAISALAFWISCLFFLLLKASLTFFSSWWIRAPLTIVILAAWVFLALLAIAGRVDDERARAAAASGGPLLSTLVPDDAEGEVARVLGCADYFSVLEVPLTADEREVKKSYRRKIVLVHPDKNGQAAHSDEAFDRVRNAFATLSDDNERTRYEADLVEAYRRAAMSERAGGSAGGGGGESGGSRRSRATPAPRSSGPRGRKARRRG